MPASSPVSSLTYSDEVEGCYGIRPVRTPESVYEAVHAELDELLPGDGSLPERRQSWRERRLCPGDRAIDVLRDLLPVLRRCTVALVELPAGEEVVLEPVSDEPWWAFNYYLGDVRSRVVLNTDVPTTGADLLHLVAHEVYPGHHTEHAVKERLLGVEERIQLVPTPQAVLSEGIAETGLDVVLDDAAREEAFAIMRGHGLDLVDPDLAERISRAVEPLRTVSVDAALMIHEEGASLEDAAGVHRALDPRHARGCEALGQLRHRPDLACLHDHVLGGPRSVPRLRRRRPRSLPHLAHRAGADRRATSSSLVSRDGDGDERARPVS